MTDQYDVDLRYSVSHSAWFWSVRRENPWPHTFIGSRDRTLSVDPTIDYSGMARRRKAADRQVRRAKRKIERKIARAEREIASG